MVISVRSVSLSEALNVGKDGTYPIVIVHGRKYMQSLDASAEAECLLQSLAERQTLSIYEHGQH